MSLKGDKEGPGRRRLPLDSLGLTKYSVEKLPADFVSTLAEATAIPEGLAKGDPEGWVAGLGAEALLFAAGSGF